MLCDASGLEYSDTESSMLMNSKDAEKRLRERSVELRRRYLREQNAQKDKAIREGLERVEASYRPLRLHPEVYAESFPADALLIDINTAFDASSSAMNEPIPKTYSIALLTKEHCMKIYEEFLHYEKIAQGQPNLKLPLNIRHDGNLGSLQNCGFAPLLHAVEV